MLNNNNSNNVTIYLECLLSTRVSTPVPKGCLRKLSNLGAGVLEKIPVGVSADKASPPPRKAENP